MTNEQIELEYTLIEEMKEEYHQKIHLLEAERTQLMKNLKQEVNSASMLKYSSKIDSLEVELR